ncbi:MAG: hypothetical protein AAB659_01105 [Patescibacteria group bacterium]
MKLQRLLRSSALATLLLKEPVYPLRDLRNELDAIIKNDGEPGKYVELYYKIPAFMKNLRNKFFERIFRKAKRENWKVEKLAAIASEIY